MLDIIKIAFFVVAGIFVVSILNDNPLTATSDSDRNSSEQAELNESYMRSYDKNGNGVVDAEEYRLGELARITEELEVLTRNLEDALREENKSPYAEFISLSNSNFDADRSDEEYVTIQASSRLATPVRITGWKIKSLVSGRTKTIPKGASFYTPSRTRRTTRDIFLAPNERAVVISGDGDNFDTSFLTNACTGYLAESYDFVPSLSRSCPRLIDENLAQFRISPTAFDDPDDYDDCIEAIEDVSMCQEGDPSSRVPGRCRVFIEDYSDYAGCYDLHQYDTDFLGSEWRIFLQSGTDVWRSEREAVALIDSNGKVVDIIERR